MAILLFYDSSFLSIPYIVVGGATDFFDGLLARRYKLQTRFGTWLDPLGDKLFAFAVVWSLYDLSLVTPWQIICIFSRDIAVSVFTLELFFFKWARSWTVQSFTVGKWATALQFALFIVLLAGVKVPNPFYWFMGALGPLSLGQLHLLLYKKLDESSRDEDMN